MAQQGVFELGGGDGGSVREDLANFVSNIDRDETPFVSSVGSAKASSTTHAWLTDSYRDPLAQAVVEGAAFATTGGSEAAGTDAVQSNRTRLNNFTQIFRSQIEVSNTSIAVDTAGIANEFAYQLKKKGVEVRRNREFQFVSYNATSTKVDDADGSTARRAGGIATWVGAPTTALRNVVDTASTGATISYATPGTGATRPTVSGGTAAVVDRDNIEALMTRMYRNGGKPNVLMCSATTKPTLSSLFSANSTTSERRLGAMEKKLNIAITGIITDFGFDLGIVPNYMMDLAGAEGVIYAYDSSKVKSAMLRPLMSTKLDDDGDGKRAIVVEECTLQVMNPNSVGILLRVNG